jgi:SAM-dependent methyltransferase
LVPLAVNLSIVQPQGYVHSLCFLDQARYLRYHLARLGVDCRLSKNRLYRDRVNIVFGAHLGFDAQLTRQFACVFFNLEQVGPDGAALTPDYLKLIASQPTLDYDAQNQCIYAPASASPLVTFLDAPYLRAAQPSMPLAQRPIDLLFFGSGNERRRELIGRIEATGRQVAVFDQPLYGPERDELIVQAKAVLNIHFYESARLEQPRISHCLSLGTPVISERGPGTSVPADYEAAVFWVPPAGLARFVQAEFGSERFYAEAVRKMDGFARLDATERLRPLLPYLDAAARAFQAGARQAPPPPARRMHLGSRDHYLAGWINVDTEQRYAPDLCLDLAQELALPATLRSETLGQVTLAPGCLETIYARNALQRAGDLSRLMEQALVLLRDDGLLAIEVPYAGSPAAGRDPDDLRRLNENSWIPFCDRFWSQGWFSHRFTVAHLEYLDARMNVCPREEAWHLRVLLKRVPTTLQERMQARLQAADFGPGLDDPLPAGAGAGAAARPAARPRAADPALAEQLP